MRRGEIRTVLLHVLYERPGHGYDIIHRLEDKSGGAWRPSAGSVYPTLKRLEDEGLATSTEANGRKVYRITEFGASEARRRLDRDGDPYSGLIPASKAAALFRSISALALAAKQVSAAGTPVQLACAVKVIDEARRQVYRLLADGSSG